MRPRVRALGVLLACALLATTGCGGGDPAGAGGPGQPKDPCASAARRPHRVVEDLRAHGAKVATTIDAVSERLTTEAMREMNAAVDLRAESPAAVADRFLRRAELK